MKFEGTQVFGIENALIGMRLPMSKDFEDAKSKSDLGENDIKVCKNLINADSSGGGQPNSKFLRMIHCQVAITAPLFWWKEADTYKVGTTANSSSTMHRIHSYPITRECFEMDDYRGDKVVDDYWDNQIKFLETLRQTVVNCENQDDKKRYWKELIRALPESWLQTRMFDCDYATLRNIYKWRKNHKLSEWHQFCDWMKTLPYFKEFLEN